MNKSKNKKGKLDLNKVSGGFKIGDVGNTILGGLSGRSKSGLSKDNTTLTNDQLMTLKSRPGFWVQA